MGRCLLDNRYSPGYVELPRYDLVAGPSYNDSNDTACTGYPNVFYSIRIPYVIGSLSRIGIPVSCIFQCFHAPHYTILPRFLDHVDAVLGSRFTRRRRVALGRRRHSARECLSECLHPPPPHALLLLVIFIVLLTGTRPTKSYRKPHRSRTSRLVSGLSAALHK